MNDEEFLKRVQNTTSQARGFREIVMLVLKGLGDKDPYKFVGEVKEIIRKVAEKEV